MAALRVTCPSCKTVLQVGEQSFGKAVRCPKCQTVLKIPAAAPAVSAPARPPTAAVAPAVTPRAPADVRTAAVPTAAPRNPGIAPKRSPATPPPPAAAPPLFADAPARGAKLFPGVAIGALVILLVGCGMVVGLYLLTRMIGSTPPPAVVEHDKGPAANPTRGPTDDNNPPNTSDRFDARFIADSFTGAVVVRPQQLLESDNLSGLPLDDWLKPFAALGLDPRQVEEADLFLDPPPGGAATYSYGGVVHFAQPVDGKKLVQTLSPKAKEATLNGKTYFTLEQMIGSVRWAVYVADDRTIAAAPEPTLKKMLSAKGTKSPLIDRLRAADLDDDVTAIVVLEPMRSMVTEMVKQGSADPTAPPAVRDGLALADKVNAITFTANLTKDPLLAVDLEAKDANAAQAALKMVNDGRAFVKEQYGEYKAGPLNGAPPDVVGLMDRFSGELNNSFTAAADGSHVRISVNRPASTKALIAKVGPMAAQLVAANPMGGPNPPPPPAPDVPVVGTSPEDWTFTNLKDKTPRLDLRFNENNHRFGILLRDGHKQLTFDEMGKTNNTIVNIEGSEYFFGDQQGENRVISSKDLPKSRGRYGNVTVMDFPKKEIRVTQHVEIVPGQSGLLDTCLVWYHVVNYGKAATHVGVRFMLDTYIGSNDGVPFAAPNFKSLIKDMHDFGKDDIPPYLEVVENGDNPQDPGTVVRLGLQNIRLPGVDHMEPPDDMRVTHFPPQQGRQRWDVPMASIRDEKGGDSCVAIYWPQDVEHNPVAAMSGGSVRDMAFTYGLSNLEISTGGGGAAVALSPVDTQPPDSTFSVTAYVYNVRPGDTVELHLPDGLTFAGGDAAQKTLDEGGPRVLVSWKVHAGKEGVYPIEATSRGAKTKPLDVVVKRGSIFG